MSDDRLLTITDFADRIGVTRQTIHRWIAAEKIPTIRIGRKRWISLGQIRRDLTPLYEHLQQSTCNNT